jgi:hypothetical protein
VDWIAKLAYTIMSGLLVRVPGVPGTNVDREGKYTQYGT